MVILGKKIMQQNHIEMWFWMLNYCPCFIEDIINIWYHSKIPSPIPKLNYLPL